MAEEAREQERDTVDKNTLCYCIPNLQKLVYQALLCAGHSLEIIIIIITITIIIIANHNNNNNNNNDNNNNNNNNNDRSCLQVNPSALV